MSDSRLFFSLRNSDGYSVIAFPSELATAHMADVREAGDRIVAELTTARCPACLVDLTALNYMGSALVASVVRIWKTIKAQDGRMVVVVSNDQVTEVLRVAKLTKVWTIANSFESGVHLLGYSSEAKLVRQQGQILTYLGPPSLFLALSALSTHFTSAFSATPIKPWVIYAFSGLGFFAGLIAFLRERKSSGWQRQISLAVTILSLLTAGAGYWTIHHRNAAASVSEPAATGEATGTDEAVGTGEAKPGNESGSADASTTTPDAAAPAGTPAASGTEKPAEPAATIPAPAAAEPATTVPDAN